MNTLLFFLAYLFFSFALFFDEVTLAGGGYLNIFALSAICLFFSICCIAILILNKKYTLLLLSIPIVIGGGCIINDIISRTLVYK